MTNDDTTLSCMSDFYVAAEVPEADAGNENYFLVPEYHGGSIRLIHAVAGSLEVTIDGSFETVCTDRLCMGPMQDNARVPVRPPGEGWEIFEGQLSCDVWRRERILSEPVYKLIKR
jgi:hypothetical protein